MWQETEKIYPKLKLAEKTEQGKKFFKCNKEKAEIERGVKWV